MLSADEHKKKGCTLHTYPDQGIKLVSIIGSLRHRYVGCKVLEKTLHKVVQLPVRIAVVCEDVSENNEEEDRCQASSENQNLKIEEIK